MTEQIKQQLEKLDEDINQLAVNLLALVSATTVMKDINRNEKNKLKNLLQEKINIRCLIKLGLDRNY